MKTYANSDHRIVHGDAVAALRATASGTVDLAFIDPPYNIGKDFNGLKDKMDEEVYFSWFEEWITEIRRVLKPTSTCYVMNSTQNMPRIDLHCRNIFHIQSRIAWTYDSSGVQARRYFGSMYEPILHMTCHPKVFTFNADEILVEAKTGAKRGLMDYRKTPPEPYSTTKVPGNVWDFSRVRFRMEEYEDHPSQKPESLLERIILASSNPGDLVLDPFSGSFTTGAVAARLGRRTLNIEVNESYVKIGLRRLSIDSHYTLSELTKTKARKTTNLSKKDHDLALKRSFI